MLPVPAQFTVPPLVMAVLSILVLLPEIFIIPLVVSVSELPLKVPPDQLNCPPNITGAGKLIVPLLKLTVSLDPGMPDGVQLLVLNQSVEAAPVQVKVAA